MSSWAEVSCPRCAKGEPCPGIEQPEPPVAKSLVRVLTPCWTQDLRKRVGMPGISEGPMTKEEIEEVNKRLDAGRLAARERRRVRWRNAETAVSGLTITIALWAAVAWWLR